MTDAVASPCVRECCLDLNDICCGCGRSVDEIMQWSSANDDLKKQILLNARQRKQKFRHKQNDNVIG